MKKFCSIIFLILFCSIKLSANNTTSHTFFSITPQYQLAMPERISLFYDRMNLRVQRTGREDDYMCDISEPPKPTRCFNNCAPNVCCINTEVDEHGICLHRHQKGISGCLEIVPFGSRSMNPDDLAEYFLPFHKTKIIAGEFGSQAVFDNTVDIIANYFGVLTRPVNEVFSGIAGFHPENLTFQSTISFAPVQTVAGVGFTYRQKVYKWSPKHDVWVQASFPLMYVSNNLGFCEKIENAGGGTQGVSVPQGFVSSVGQALRGNVVFGDQRFLYGKIYDGTKSHVGIGDIELGLGFDNTSCDIFDRMMYGGFIIPTGNTPNAEYIFEPIVGNNHHWGIFISGEFCYQWWQNCSGTLSLWLHSYGYSQLLFANYQKRIIDLIDKEWSRYIWLYQQVETQGGPLNAVPGVNFLTQNVRVEARSSFQSSTSLVFNACNWSFEGGYNTYYRQAEHVELKDCFAQGPMIVGIDDTDTNIFATKSNATMPDYLTNQGVCLDRFPDGARRLVPIKQCDLNIESAAHPCLIGHMVFASFGYSWDQATFPTLAALGGSYEFTTDNLGLHRFTVWAKVVVSF